MSSASVWPFECLTPFIWRNLDELYPQRSRYPTRPRSRPNPFRSLVFPLGERSRRRAYPLQGSSSWVFVLPQNAARLERLWQRRPLHEKAEVRRDERVGCRDRVGVVDGSVLP